MSGGCQSTSICIYRSVQEHCALCVCSSSDTVLSVLRQRPPHALPRVKTQEDCANARATTQLLPALTGLALPLLAIPAAVYNEHGWLGATVLVPYLFTLGIQIWSETWYNKRGTPSVQAMKIVAVRTACGVSAKGIGSILRAAISMAGHLTPW